jgi:type IV fimbrial biogenesis protein FimT
MSGSRSVTERCQDRGIIAVGSPRAAGAGCRSRAASRRVGRGGAAVRPVSCHRCGWRLSGGFGLIELATTTAVAAVVLALAVPSLGGLLANTRLEGAAQALVTHMAFARTQAVSRGVPVSMCSSSDGRTCSGDLDWRSGWLVFLGAAPADGEVGAADVMRVGAAAGEGVHLKASHAAFTYLSDGSLDASVTLRH